MELVNSATRRRLQAYHPQVVEEIDNLQRVLADSGLDARLLALCGDYFRAALRDSPWSPPAAATELDTACLGVCEQFMIGVSEIDDEQIAALRQHLGTDDVYNLMYAIYLIEMSQRLDLTLERVLQ